MDPPNSKTTSGSSSSQQAVGPVAKAPPTSSSLQANFQPVGQQEDARPPYMQDVHSLLMQQDQKFQAMLSQVMQHVMAMQSNQPTQHYPMNTEEWIEGQEPWREHDPQEENLMAQFGDLDFMSSDEIQPEKRGDGELEMNPWRIVQDVKPGLSQQIAQAWERHERDRRLVSKSSSQVRSVFEMQFEKEMENHLNETFVTTIIFPDCGALPSDGPLVQEIFTASSVSLKRLAVEDI